jgi:hypothetical protein
MMTSGGECGNHAGSIGEERELFNPERIEKLP